MPDFSVEALARKWCRQHGQWPIEGFNGCDERILAAAIHEALEEAEKIANAEEGATWDAGATLVKYCRCPERIAVAIRALRGRG